MKLIGLTMLLTGLLTGQSAEVFQTTVLTNDGVTNTVYKLTDNTVRIESSTGQVRTYKHLSSADTYIKTMVGLGWINETQLEREYQRRVAEAAYRLELEKERARKQTEERQNKILQEAYQAELNNISDQISELQKIKDRVDAEGLKLLKQTNSVNTDTATLYKGLDQQRQELFIQLQKLVVRAEECSSALETLKSKESTDF